MTPDIRWTGTTLAREPDFRLGALEVRPSRREMVCGEDRILLEPQVMRLLILLVRHRGDVVSREELIEGCWDGRVVGDDAINACVAKARRAGEATGSYTIETIPRVGYRLQAEPAVAAPPLADSGEVLLAVLPFENLSDDPQLSYFSDGVSEEILHTLAQRTRLKLIGRSSSFQLRGRDKSIANVMRQLNATHVLDGAVRRSGRRTRISAQLIDCATQTAVWADRFEVEQADIFTLQDQVATAVAQAMRCALAPAVRSGAVDPAAYDLYLRAGKPPTDMSTAYRAEIALLEEAVDFAPNFADAWASLGFLRAHQSYLLAGAAADAARADARAAALHALTLDPVCALAAAAMARATPGYGPALLEHGDWLDSALAWEPDNPAATHLRARFLSSVGRGREALAYIRRAHRLDPLDLHIVAMLGRTLCEVGELDEAVRVLDEVRDRWDEFQLLPLWMVITLGCKGEVEAARNLLAQHTLRPYEAELKAFFGSHVEPTATSRAQVIAALRAQAPEGRADIPTLCAAAEHGHVDEVFETATRAVLGPTAQSEGSGYNLSILFTYPMRAIRRDPRFIGLCRKLGLVEYWLTSGTWPDCVEETAPHYDFEALCREPARAATAC